MKLVQILLFVACLMGGTFLAAQIQEEQEPKRPVTRAKRPSFEKKDWESVFYDDIFTEGLVGQRPGNVDPSTVKPVETAPVVAASDSAQAWNDLVEGFVLENEVKRWQQNLMDLVTTPVKYKTSHTEIGEQFSMLAMWFAIIGQYEGDVRWKAESASAMTAFVDAAFKSRKTDISSFNNVKQRTEDLAELVRGGKFPDEPNAKKEVDDWAVIVDRNPIMNRLELAVATELKQPTASEKDFIENIDLVVHEASLIAAMARVLQSPEMMDADDEDYNAYAQEMLAAAQEMKVAAKEKDLERVNAALNRVNQSCVGCHGDWR